MSDAIEQLLKDHKMVRKILTEFRAGHPRYAEITNTLRRVVLAHAWFEDEFLLPALKNQPAIFRPFWDEIAQEHEHIGTLLRLVRDPGETETLDAYILTLRTVLDTHFKKEEDALFPLAQKVITREGLEEMAKDMERRKTEVRTLIEP